METTLYPHNYADHPFVKGHPAPVAIPRAGMTFMIAKSPIANPEGVVWSHAIKGTHAVVPLIPYLIDYPMPGGEHFLAVTMFELGMKAICSVKTPYADIHRLLIVFGNPIQQVMNVPKLRVYLGLALELKETNGHIDSL